LAPCAILSPQHLQIGWFIAFSAPGEFPQHSAPVPDPMMVADGAQRME
jgi:hypothetical protein